MIQYILSRAKNHLEMSLNDQDLSDASSDDENFTLEHGDMIFTSRKFKTSGKYNELEMKKATKLKI